MNKQLTERERLYVKLNHLDESQIAEVLTYVKSLESTQATPISQSSLLPETNDDDFISLLSTAYENRRARQVFEWEAIRRRADKMASTQHYAQP